jgi:UDPglucose 6-dehydrogenase
MRPERVVIGTSSKRAGDRMVELYEPFVRNGNPIYVVSERSAEVAKYAANSFIAMRISFINEMANFCEKVGADIDDVRMAIGSDSRIGKKYLFPGVGYGGSCFPKDVKAILKTAHDYGMELQVIDAVERVNKLQPVRFFEKVRNYFDGNLSGRRIAIWGAAFKANTDDVREAPAFVVIDQLLEAGAEVAIYDPEAMEGARQRYGDRIHYGASMYETVRNADALMIATEWNEFRNPDFDRLKECLREPVIFDGRNLFNAAEIAEKGFLYLSVGRAPVDADRVVS